MGTMPFEPPEMSDPRVLRALAHPTRARILDELGAVGPMRAADVGEALGIPANQASFHLRQLEKYGLIVPAPEAARDKRDRVYRMPDESGFRLDVDTIEQQPGGKAALSVFQQNQAAWAHRQVDEVFAFQKRPETFSAIVDQPLKLTKDEAAAFMGEISEVLKDWSARTRGRDTSRQTYLFYAMVQPYPEDAKEK
jgi:DNA-binding transcriptional ArsR family regulator